jgi:hypothetical protein
MQHLSLAAQARENRKQLANAHETTQPPPPQQEQPSEPTETKAADRKLVENGVLVGELQTGK